MREQFDTSVVHQRIMALILVLVKGLSKHGLLTMGTCKKGVKLAKHFPSEQEPALKRISQ